MTLIKKPRADTAAHRAVMRLADLGGSATASQLMSCLDPEYASRAKFTTLITARLSYYGYADYNGDLFTLTPLGHHYVAIVRDVPRSSTYVGKIVPPRTPQAFRPLRPNHAAGPVRPGSQDHLAIPSLMGIIRKLPSGEIIK